MLNNIEMQGKMNQTDQKNEQAYELMFTYFNELGIISQLSSRMFEKNLPAELTMSQFSVLNWFVRVDDQATPGRLSTAFQVTKGAMTNTLKKLHEKALVSIEPDANSGRSKIVRLTPNGRKVRDSAVAAAYPLMNDLANSIDLPELTKQMKGIQKLRLYLDEYRYK
jgi:DNA-binding MarR family transcriptional regulator